MALSPAQTHNTLCNCLYRAGRPRHLNMTPCQLAERSLLPPASENSTASCTLKMTVPPQRQFTYAEKHGVMCHKCATLTSTAHLLCGSHVSYKLCTEQVQPCTTCHTPATHISVFIKMLLRDRRRSLPCSEGAATCHTTHVLPDIKNICIQSVFDGVRRIHNSVLFIPLCLSALKCTNSAVSTRLARIRKTLDSPGACNCGGQVNRGRMTTQGCSIMKRWAVRFIIGFRCAVSNFNGCFRHATRSRQEGKQQTGKQSKRGKPNCLTNLIRLTSSFIHTGKRMCPNSTWCGLVR